LREADRIGPGERGSLTASAERQQYDPDAPVLKCCDSFCSLGMSDSTSLLDEPPTLASSAAAVVGLLVEEEIAASFQALRYGHGVCGHRLLGMSGPDLL